MKHLRRISLVVFLFSLALTVPNTRVTQAAAKGLYPDLVTVVPHKLELVNQQGRTTIRFSNSVANVGDGPLQLRPDTPLSSGPANVLQDILDSDGNVVSTTAVSRFVFDSSYKAWEVLDVAQYSIHTGSPTGPTISITTKMACCFINWYSLDGNAPTPDRNPYWDCGTMQGLSVGWADQYHASTEGQSLDMTGQPAGRYYLVSVANPSQLYLEKDYSNDTAWVSFDLVFDNTGNAKINLVDHSPCSTPGLCGTNAPNR